MAEGADLGRVLASKGFEPATFVGELAKRGENSLLETKQKLISLNDKTALSLKQNVYKNYSQFIETAREIAILEGEMYQLSHMLTEQKGLMSSMLELSLVSDKAVMEAKEEEEEKENPEEETRKNLAFLLDKVEGCSSVTEVPGRQLVHDGDLVELDPETHSQVQRVHAFLLSDSLMIATWVPNRRGPVRYKFQGLYELDSLAVVNVRDVGPSKNAFKILMFPDTHMYQTDGAKAKRQWLDILDDTKQKKAARDKQKKEAAQRQVEEQRHSVISARSPEVEKNPFADADAEALAEMDCLDSDFLHEDWLQELPEDLDMCIAQRDFKGGVDLVEKVNNFLKDKPKTPAVKEFRARIDHRIKQLTEGLVSELQVSPERSLRGGPRAARRAVEQLIRLGKSSQACELFLKNRSAIIKYNIRQLKFEGATTLYIRCLCGVFFTSLSETAREFWKAFPQHYGCYSAFVVWAKQELNAFVGTFRRQVFESKSSLSTMADCVQLAKSHCQELSSIGLDLEFILASMLENPIRLVVEEARDQFIESIKFRGSEDLWRPMNHLNAAECSKFVQSMAAVGLTTVGEYVFDECFVALTMNTVQFAKSVLAMAGELLKLFAVELEDFITEALVAVFQAQVLHFRASLTSDRFAREHKFILRNAQFVLEQVMSEIERMYGSAGIVFPKQLLEVSAEYRRLKTLAKA